MLNVEPINFFTMIYNQKQRQLIIWEQRETKAIIKSFVLLFNLGFRLWIRTIDKKYFSTPATHLGEAQPMLINEQIVR